MEIIVEIILILVLSRAFGEWCERKGQPAVIGELLVGIILGPAVLGWISPETYGLKVLADLGIFFLVFAAGLEFSLAHIRKFSVRAFPISFMGNNLAFFSGIYMALMLGYSLQTGIFIGAGFSLTALAVTLRVLGDMRKDRTDFGQLVVTSAVYDDLFSMFILALVFSLAASQNANISLSLMLVILIKIAIFLCIIFAIDRALRWKNEYPTNYIKHYIRKFHSREAEFTVVLLAGLLLAMLGEAMGISYIIGAFYSGVLIGERVIGERVYRKIHASMSAITFGFFAPIFFVYTGTHFIPLSEMTPWMWGLAGIFVAVAFVGKTFGAYIGARLANVGRKSAWAAGIALNSRGIMQVVIATVGYEMGLINRTIFSLLVITSIATTLMTPSLLMRYLKKHGADIDDLRT